MPYFVREYPRRVIEPNAWLRDTMEVVLTPAQVASIPFLHVSSWDQIQSFDEWIGLRGIDQP